MIRKLLCLLGLHKWKKLLKFGLSGFEFEKVCKHCGKVGGK